WDKKMESHWTIGEKGEAAALHHFLDHGLKDYKEGRNYMARDNVSRLSPRLHFGELSPNQLWHAAKHKGASEHWNSSVDNFCAELGWREFSHHLLYHFPALPRAPIQTRFSKFPWVKNDAHLTAWQTG